MSITIIEIKQLGGKCEALRNNHTVGLRGSGEVNRCKAEIFIQDTISLVDKRQLCANYKSATYVSFLYYFSQFVL